MSLPSLKQGDRVRVVYQLETERVPRSMIATFLSRESRYGRDSYVLSGRPVFGTTELPVSAVRSIQLVARTIHPRRPRKES